MGTRPSGAPASLAVAAAAALLILGAFAAPAVAAGPGVLVLTQSTTLTADYDGNVVIAADDITLDCAGHTIRGSGLVNEPGIRIQGFSGVTVKRCVVEGFLATGLMTVGSSNLVIEKNVVRGNDWNGFLIETTTDSRFTGNTAVGNGPNPGVGFWIRWGSSGNLFERNNATGNANAGFLVEWSDSLTFVSNSATDNAWDGFAVIGSAGSVLRGNVVAGGGKNGFLLLGTTDAWVENNSELSSPWAGFGLYDSQGATLVGNTASGPGGAGFDVDGSSGNTLKRNMAMDNAIGNGFSLGPGAVLNVLTENAAIGNNQGFLVAGSTQNVLARNLATHNNYGFITQQGAAYNTLAYNVGRASGELDAREWLGAADNTWLGNNFGSTSGF